MKRWGQKTSICVALAGFWRVEPGATLRPTTFSGCGVLTCEEGQRTPGMESEAWHVYMLRKAPLTP